MSVHVPEEGNPLSATLPVATVQVGWVIAPTTGAVWLDVLTTTFAELEEVQPDALVTVNV